VFIAAGMAQENWLRVAARAMALGIGLYLVPLAMIASPALIGLAETPFAALGAFVKTALGLGAVSVAVIAPLRPVRRALLLVGGLALVLLPWDALAPG